MLIDGINAEIESFGISKNIEPIWNGRNVPLELEEPKVIRLAQLIHETNASMMRQQSQLKPLGEGHYEVSVDKDVDGTNSVTGNVSYETDNGTRVDAEVSVDSKGNTSGSVSVSGTF